MRIVAAVLIAAALGLVLTAPLQATENQAAFSKRVSKYATIDPEKPKGLCWCKGGFDGPGTGEAGYVVQIVTSGQVGVKCMIPEFNGSAPPFLVPCVVEWDMLGK